MKSVRLLCVAMLAMVGLKPADASPVSTGPSYNPRRSDVNFRTRRVEYKDATGVAAEVLTQVKDLTQRFENLAKSNQEQKDIPATVKNLAEDIKGLRGDLAEYRKSEPELKAFVLSATGRLDAIEKRLNAINVNGVGGAGNKPKKFAEVKSLDADMRAGRDVEVKSLDSDLKMQDVFYDDVVIDDYPVIEMAYQRPCGGDAPSFSFPTGATVVHKGAQGGTTNERKKVKGEVYDYHYQPTLDESDVQDTGSLLLDDESSVFAEGCRERLNADLWGDLEDKAEAVGTAGFDQYVNPVLVTTAANTGFTVADIDTLIASLPKKYRNGAVFACNAAMTAKLKTIKDAATGVSLWQPSLAAGTPATLRGYKFIEDETLEDNRLVFGNPRRGFRIGIRQAPALTSMERSAGDYKPSFKARYAPGLFDARAWKVMDKKA